MKKILALIILNFVFSNLENSEFHYIDQIDSIKELEFLHKESLNMGDTLKSINILIDLVDKIEISDYFSNEIISDYYYKIGHLYYLINDSEKSESFFLKSIESYNKSMLRNQLLMEAPLSDLKLIYKNEKDSISLNAVLNRIKKIRDLKNNYLLDSIRFTKISVESFDESVEKSELDILYSNLNIAEQSFDQGLYSKSIQNLIASMNFRHTEVNYDYYYNLSILDSVNIEYIKRAVENSAKDDTLNSQAYDFFNSIINVKTKDYNKALTFAKKYSSNYPNDVKGYNLLADIYYKKQMWSQSLFYYFRTLLNDKSNLILRFKMSNCMQYLNRYDEAISNLKHILKIDSYFYDAYLELGKLYIKQGYFRKAQKILTDFLLFKPNSKEGYYYLGESYFNQNKYNFAMDAFNKTINIDKSFSDAHYYLGLINESILKYEQAEYHYEKARIGGTSFIEMNLNYGSLLYATEKYKKAIKPLEDYIEYFEYDNNQIMSLEYKDALMKLGDIFFIEKRYSESVSCYQKLINKFPEDWFLNSRIAESLYFLKNVDLAINTYNNILTLYPDDINSMVKLGDIFFEQGNFLTANNYYNMAVDCGGQNKDLIYKSALCYAYTEKFFQALIAFKRVDIIEPNNWLNEYQIGVTYMELGIYEKAILFFEKNEQDTDSKFMMGICYYKLNEYKKSLDYLLKYLNEEKNNSQLYYYMGLSYFFLEDYKNSAKNLKISLKTDEDNIDALSKLGIVYVKLNKKREAQKIANKLYYLDREEYNILNKVIKLQ